MERTIRMQLVAAFGLITLISVLYASIFAWDEQYDLGADGRKTGPWGPWQVALFLLGLLCSWIWFSWKGFSTVVVTAAPVITTSWWIYSAVNLDDGQTLWPVGALLVFTGTGIASIAVVRLVGRIKDSPRADRVPIALRGGFLFALLGIAVSWSFADDFVIVFIVLAAWLAVSRVIVNARIEGRPGGRPPLGGSP